MRSFEKIYSLSTENHGLVTTTAATKLGVYRKDLSRWVKTGRLMKIGHGVYRVTLYPHSEEDAFAIAVIKLGPKAYLCGESVLALLDLAPTNPRYFHVAVFGRSRRRIGDDCKVEIRHQPYMPMTYEGIPIERPIDAIRGCIGKIMQERLEFAANEAYRRGFICNDEKEELIKEIKHDEQTSA